MRSEHKGRISPLRIPIRNDEKMKKTWSKKVFPGKDVEESCRVNEQNQEQESLSGESGVEENGRVEEQNLKNKFLSG